MTYAAFLRQEFADLDPVVDDLYLLEAHQIAGLPERAPPRELAAVLHSHPGLHRFFINRHPPIAGPLTRLLAEHAPAAADEIEACEEALVWEIADWIVYQRDPASYDTLTVVDWDLEAVTEIATLEGKVVIDAGAGTGRVAFSAAPIARHVFAVEPVARLRRFIREKAAELEITNLFVLDGLLHAIPLPAAAADALLTCQAIGWHLTEELAEIERVVKPGGFAMHLFGAPEALQFDSPLHRPLVANGYQPEAYRKRGVHIARYWKQVEAG